MKVFGNKGLANGIPVVTAAPDEVYVLDPTQTGTAPISKNKSCGYSLCYRAPTTHRRIHQSMIICRQRNVQAHHLLLRY